MAEDLIQKLRTCKPEERLAAALELARTEKSEAVEELIRMAEGRRRGFLRWYSKDDQITGIRALGETKSGYALWYLDFLLLDADSEYDFVIDRNDSGSGQHVCYVNFEIARKKLHLPVSGKIEGPSERILTGGLGYGRSNPSIGRFDADRFKQNAKYFHSDMKDGTAAYKAISASIDKLRSTVKVAGSHERSYDGGRDEISERADPFVPENDSKPYDGPHACGQDW